MKLLFLFGLILTLFFIDFSFCEESSETECDNPVDLILILDHSESILEDEWDQVKDFANSVVDRFNVRGDSGAYIAIIQFATRAELSMCLTGSTCALRKGIETSADVGGTTNIYSGLELSQTEFNEHGRTGDEHQKLVVLITDGADNTNTDEKLKGIADDLKDDDVKIYCIGVKTTDTNKDRMFGTFELIASDPFDEHVEYVEEGYSGLGGVLSDIINNECVEFSASSCPGALIVLSLLLLLLISNMVPLFKIRPETRRYTYYAHYVTCFFLTLVFILVCALTASNNSKTQYKLCVAIIVFTVLGIVTSIVSIAILWKQHRDMTPPKGLSKAGLATFEHGGQTPSGMKAFRTEETKVDVPYDDLKEHLDGRLMHEEEEN
ncbi:anthrax toxin receptor-like [Anaeramoeba flamelloides]|uniref:Anthrax toxin receptor-like n=1 Tax=Anaeramoeba flamelloides TaxID=1746091 RepID=A0ABQ8Y9S8_9EUKA|nr:anthrax toxin receptor-like [Anaeramoeba flamelloides]